MKYHKDQLYIKATGANQYAGGSKNWLKIRSINDEGTSYTFHVVIRGMEKFVEITKKSIKSGEGTPNLAFRIRSMPATVDSVLTHYFGKPVL